MELNRYTWNGASAIQAADFRTLESGAVEAYLHAPQGSAVGSLASIPQALSQRGLSTVTDTIDGESVLRISGFKNSEELLNVLNQAGFVQGEPQQQTIGEKEQKSFADKVRKQTVKISGLFGIVGHASMAVAGVLERDYKRVGTSAFYIASTSTSAIYGAGKPGGEFEKLIGDMRQYLTAQGIEIPKDDKLTAQELAKKGGVIEKLHEFIQKRPLEVGNTIGLMGNMLFTYSGMKDGGVGVSRTVSGIASMIGALSVILVQEKQKGKGTKYEWPGMENEPGLAAQSPSPEQIAAQQEKRSVFRKAADFVQEKPMRFAGLMNLAGNIAMFSDVRQIHNKHSKTLSDHRQSLGIMEDRLSQARQLGGDPALEAEYKKSMKDYQRAQTASKSTIFAFTTAACYLLATTFTSLSSKAKPVDYDEKETLGKLCAMSAEMLASQPADMRDQAIDKMATFLAKEEKITESREEIIKILHEKVESLGRSPWQAKLATQQAVAQNIPSQNAAQLS